jgi:hypothetical protein
MTVSLDPPIKTPVRAPIERPYPRGVHCSSDLAKARRPERLAARYSVAPAPRGLPMTWARSAGQGEGVRGLHARAGVRARPAETASFCEDLPVEIATSLPRNFQAATVFELRWRWGGMRQGSNRSLRGA